MAGKWHLFLHHLHAVLKSVIRFGRRSSLGWRPAIVLFCLTLVLCLVTSPELARSSVPANPPAPESPVQINTEAPLESQAQEFYANGRYAEAIAVLQQALNQVPPGDALTRATLLSNLALSYQALGDWQSATASVHGALKFLETVPNSRDRQNVLAQTLDVQGSLFLGQGNGEAALTTWEQAADLHTRLGNAQRATLSQINRAQAMQSMGLYRRAIVILGELQKSADTHPNPLVRAVILQSLGNALRVAGDPNEAEKVLQESLKLARERGTDSLIKSLALDLGNVALAQSRVRVALENNPAAREALQMARNYYQQAATATDPLIRARAGLNHLYLLTETASTLLPGVNRQQEAQALYPQVQRWIAELPNGRAKVDLQLGLGQRLIKLQSDRTTITQLFATATKDARELDDRRALSLAIGNRGNLAEQAEQWEEAATLTREALVLAQSINAADIAYQWQWQLGRILKAQNQNSFAITAYTEAFNTLQSLRRDLVTVNVDVQFSFRQSVEPVYRQLVELLLAPSTPSQSDLQLARQVLEALQVAELENFLQAACQDTALQIDRVIDEDDPTAAVFYPIILDNHLDVILKLPGQGDLLYATTPVKQSEVRTILKQLQIDLQEEYTFAAVEKGGQKVYNWLVRPFRDRLPANLKTLIFVLDGPLRAIPMSILHDGQDYLVEKYATSLVLGLQVREPESLRRRELRVLAASLTDPPEDFRNRYSSLDGVNPELDKIKASGIISTQIRDQAFTEEAFRQALDKGDYQVIHLATHGQFGTTRESTYLLAADGAIHVDELDKVFRQGKRVELLILSACKTATGNDRAVLGIAGTTVRAGARSAIASLWSLADAPGALFAQSLYENLGNPGITRAEALRQAQLALKKNEEQDFSHPRFWAAYVLVGSWL